jgi:translation initiation factor 2 beta subunit (eIF-2beta)/eIF-5
MATTVSCRRHRHQLRRHVVNFVACRAIGIVIDVIVRRTIAIMVEVVARCAVTGDVKSDMGRGWHGGG